MALLRERETWASNQKKSEFPKPFKNSKLFKSLEKTDKVLKVFYEY